MNNQIDLVLPNLYAEFLSKIDKAGELIIENTGITLYSKLDLLERNSTYQIEGWEPDFFLIGQDGDVAFFIKKDSDDTIYMNNLGALGSLDQENLNRIINFMLADLKEMYGEVSEEDVKNKLGKPIIDYNQGTVSYCEQTFDDWHLFEFEFLDDQFETLECFSVNG